MMSLRQEIFAKDAHEIMQVMVPSFQAGFAADDQTREYIHEAPREGTGMKWRNGDNAM